MSPHACSPTPAAQVAARNVEYEKFKASVASADGGGDSELYPSRGVEVLTASRRNKEVRARHRVVCGRGGACPRRC